MKGLSVLNNDERCGSPEFFFDNFSKQVKRNEASRINEVIIRNSKTSIKFGVPRFLRICHLPAGQ